MEFFITTNTSVYCVYSEENGDLSFSAKKITLKDQSESEISINSKLTGKKLDFRARGMYIGKSKTSPVVALFFDKNDAINCLNSKKQYLKKWREKTEEVLKLIQDEYPNTINISIFKK
ncbi:MAG: hypothetical protein KAR54_01090 [Candidatus Pacebacteria bacterium]|nr:hypothetical protein [Candidatus Paceibacterota bacterium]